MPMTAKPLAERFWPKVVKESEGCWRWQAAKNTEGYGKFSVRRGVWRFAHRVAYELVRGPIPEGLPLDHLCRQHDCVNPDHLEPVTHWENALRGVNPHIALFKAGVCQRGHPRTPENAVPIAPRGFRCRPCDRIRHWVGDRLRGRAGTEERRGAPGLELIIEEVDGDADGGG